jgi:hypothetical protein
MDPSAETNEHHDSITGRTYTTRHRGNDAARRQARPPEDYTLMDAVASDPAPLEVNERAKIYEAINACAAANDGEVHASTLRPHLPEQVNEHLIGNVVSQLAKTGVLVETGEMRASADSRNRNARRRLPVRRVTSWDRLFDAVRANGGRA